VPLIGGTAHKLRENAFAYSWSRDGSWVAFTPRPTERFGWGSSEMWVMHPDGSEAHRLFEADKDSAFIGADWSPDGKRLACNMYRETAGKSEIFIQTRDLDRGPAITVVPSGTSDWMWGNDGRLVYGLFDPGSVGQSCNFWARPIDTTTGKPKEEGKRLTSWAGFCMDNLSETADGKRLAFRKWSWQGSVYVADLSANGTRITTPRRLTLNEGRNYPGAWTADSKAVVFGSYLDGQWRIFNQRLDQETSEPITRREDGDVVRAGVSPDGAWILYVAIPKDSDRPAGLRNLTRMYVVDRESQHLATATLKKLETIFEKQMVTWFHDLNIRFLREVSLPQLILWRGSWSDGPLAAKKKQERVRGFFYFCQRNGWISENPALGLSKIKAPQKSVEVLTAEEFDQLIKTTHHYGRTEAQRGRIRALLLWMRWSGPGHSGCCHAGTRTLDGRECAFAIPGAYECPRLYAAQISINLAGAAHFLHTLSEVVMVEAAGVEPMRCIEST
jgi:hypothetical protein